jgi:lipoprotein-anchoring transpeptidase ErfK/SrfK
MHRSLLCSALLLALAAPVDGVAAPRNGRRAPVDFYEETLRNGQRAPVDVYGDAYADQYLEDDEGGLFDVLTGRGSDRRASGALAVDPYTGLPVHSRGRTGTRGAMTALTPSYSFDPEYEGLGMAVDPIYERQMVRYSGPHSPGTVVIDTPRKFLYLVQPGGVAIRYGIGVGRPGFSWAGVKTVSMKREWPDWRPPAEMLRRRPDLPSYMPGGLDNPLGARALYLGSSLYRIHGTNEPHTIGRAVSSGCIRMLNDDVVDLYQRVRVGTRVVVI